MGLQIDYLDDHRTDPAEERRRQIWAEESRREEEEFRDYQDYMHMSRPARPTEAEQEADWSFQSATSWPAWQGWRPDSGPEGPEADFFTAEAGQLGDILGAHADFIARLEPIGPFHFTTRKRQTARWGAIIRSSKPQLPCKQNKTKGNAHLKHCIFCHNKHIFGFDIKLCFLAREQYSTRQATAMF
jgi:hypothetical protein